MITRSSSKDIADSKKTTRIFSITTKDSRKSSPKNGRRGCECGDYYLEALEKAREGLVERAREIMRLEDEVESLREQLQLAWSVSENLVEAQRQILDNAQENILIHRTKNL